MANWSCLTLMWQSDACHGIAFIISFLFLPCSHSILGIRKKCICSPVQKKRNIHSAVGLNHSKKIYILSTVGLDHSKKITSVQPFNLTIRKKNASVQPFNQSVSNGLPSRFLSFACRAFSHSNGYRKEHFRMRGHIFEVCQWDGHWCHPIQCCSNLNTIQQLTGKHLSSWK